MLHTPQICISGNTKTYDNNEMLSHQEYLEQAQRIISSYCKNKPELSHIVNTEETISDVATHMAIADWRWNKNNKAKCKQTSYRYSFAMWTIAKNVSEYIKYQGKCKYSLDYNVCDNDSLYNILEDTRLLNTYEPSEEISYMVDGLDYTYDKLKELLNHKTVTIKQKAYISERYIQHKSIKDIANLHGVTISNIHRNIKKGIVTLQKLIQDKRQIGINND